MRFNEKLSMRIFIALSLVCIVFLFSGCSSENKKEVKVENGIINLEKWDFDKNNIRLDGQWQFYWNKLLTYKEFNGDYTPVNAKVPGTWIEYDKKYQGQGYGTYRLHVKTSLPQGEILGLKFNTISSAYKLYINDKEITEVGKVSSNQNDYFPKYKPQAVFFSLPDSEFDIIIQVANFDFWKGGLWYPIKLGTVENINRFQDLVMAKELILIGALIIMAMYYLSICFIMRLKNEYLYFTVICFLSIMVFDILGELLIYRIFPNISFSLLIFIWYATTQWLSYLIVLYVCKMFPNKINEAANAFFGVLTVFITLLFLYTPTAYYTQYGKICDYIMLFSGLYGVVIAFVGYLQKKQGAVLYLIAVGILLIATTHDVLFLENEITGSFGEMLFIGIFILLFVQILIHARRFALEFNEKSQLLIEIESSKEVAIRNEIKFLQAQIKPHFLFNVLSVIASLSTREPIKARQLVINLSEYLRSSFDFDTKDDLVPISKEIDLVNAYVDIEKARFIDKINYELDCAEIPQVRIPRLSIQPLVENAIRHGILKKSGGGKITLKITNEQNSALIEVSDDGIGISENKIEDLLQNADNIKGVGIKNINGRLKRLYGNGLTIISEIGLGTKVSFKVCEKKRV